MLGGLVDCLKVQRWVEEEVASYLGGGGDLGEDLGENWAGICYVKATDIHPDIPHFTAFLFLTHSNIPHMFTLDLTYSIRVTFSVLYRLPRVSRSHSLLRCSCVRGVSGVTYL